MGAPGLHHVRVLSLQPAERVDEGAHLGQQRVLDAQHRGDGEYAEAEGIQLLELACINLLFLAGADHQLLAFLGHVGLFKFRDQLHEQHHAHNAEEVGDAVAHRHQVVQRAHRLFGGGDCGGGGQGA